MGHTQLRIGVPGGRVEHRGKREVRVIQKEERGGGGGRQKKHKKTEKAGRKKSKKNLPSDPHEN